jgi:hypothetical protein
MVIDRLGPVAGPETITIIQNYNNLPYSQKKEKKKKEDTEIMFITGCLS